MVSAIVPILLFLATAATTTWAQGPAYAVTLLSILVAHEMGHYVAARMQGVQASLPYFIPVPPFLGFFLGTMGAVIAMEEQQANRRQLLLIGAAGPIAGFLIAVPAMILGLVWSTPVSTDPSELATFGQSILSYFLESSFGPPLKEDETLLAHPVYIAAWAGFLVTALNLLPMGQFDGGHVLYALHPTGSQFVARRVFAALFWVGLGGLAVQALSLSEMEPIVGPLRAWVSPAMLVWALLGRFLGLNHPPVPEGPPLRGRDYVLAALCGIILLACFMPSPLYYLSPRSVG